MDGARMGGRLFTGTFFIVLKFLNHINASQSKNILITVLKFKRFRN